MIYICSNTYTYKYMRKVVTTKASNTISLFSTSFTRSEQPTLQTQHGIPSKTIPPEKIQVLVTQK